MVALQYYSNVGIQNSAELAIGAKSASLCPGPAGKDTGHAELHGHEEDKAD